MRIRAARPMAVAALGLFVGVAAGCGGKSKGASGAEGGMAASNRDLMPKVDPALCDTKDKRVDTFDLNQDGKADVWKLYAQMEEDGAKLDVLTCKQVDYDKDGRKDYVAIYNRRGELVAEEFDYTFDGVFDARHHYDKKSGLIYMAERAHSHERAPDTWEKYDLQGRLESIERDRNGDEKPDLWEQYQGGSLIAILYDDDFDGRVDRRESARPIPSPGGAAPTPTSTTAPGEPVDTVEGDAEEMKKAAEPATEAK